MKQDTKKVIKSDIGGNRKFPVTKIGVMESASWMVEFATEPGPKERDQILTIIRTFFRDESLAEFRFGVDFGNRSLLITATRKMDRESACTIDFKPLRDWLRLELVTAKPPAKKKAKKVTVSSQKKKPSASLST